MLSGNQYFLCKKILVLLNICDKKKLVGKKALISFLFIQYYFSLACSSPSAVRRSFQQSHLC